MGGAVDGVRCDRRVRATAWRLAVVLFVVSWVTGAEGGTGPEEGYSPEVGRFLAGVDAVVVPCDGVVSFREAKDRVLSSLGWEGPSCRRYTCSLLSGGVEESRRRISVALQEEERQGKVVVQSPWTVVLAGEGVALKSAWRWKSRPAASVTAVLQQNTAGPGTMLLVLEFEKGQKPGSAGGVEGHADRGEDGGREPAEGEAREDAHEFELSALFRVLGASLVPCGKDVLEFVRQMGGGVYACGQAGKEEETRRRIDGWISWRVAHGTGESTMEWKTYPVEGATLSARGWKSDVRTYIAIVIVAKQERDSSFVILVRGESPALP